MKERKRLEVKRRAAWRSGRVLGEEEHLRQRSRTGKRKEWESLKKRHQHCLIIDPLFGVWYTIEIWRGKGAWWIAAHDEVRDLSYK